MNRDKVLKKAKKENLWKDERKRFINIRASSIGGTFSIIFLISMICIFSGCGICKNNIVKEINTYDNKYKIVAFIRDAGATTSSSPQVSLIKANKKLSDSDTGNIFRGNKSKYIDIQWKNKNTLIVKYDCSDEDIFEKCTEIKDINIEYLKVQEKTS